MDLKSIALGLQVPFVAHWEAICDKETLLAVRVTAIFFSSIMLITAPLAALGWGLSLLAGRGVQVLSPVPSPASSGTGARISGSPSSESLDGKEESPPQIPREAYERLPNTHREELKQLLLDIQALTSWNAPFRGLGIKQRGDRLKHIPFFRYLEIVLSDRPTLEAFKSIKGDKNKWEGAWGFRGARDSIVENANAEFTRHPSRFTDLVVQGFCEKVKANYADVQPLVKQQNWVALIEFSLTLPVLST